VSLALTSAAAAAIAVVPTLVLHKGLSSSAQAGEVLRTAGTAAATQPGGWPKAAFWHVVEQEQFGSAPAQRREIWLGHTQPGLLSDPRHKIGYDRTTPALFLEGIDWDQLYQLPTEPAALAAAMRRAGVGYGPDADSELWAECTSTLTESPASPALRAAVLRVMATIPGARELGIQTDALGRSGTAIEREGETYLVDTHNGALLQRTGAGGAGGHSFRYTYISAGPADSEPQVAGPVH
jgi:hypothetical protein